VNYPYRLISTTLVNVVKLLLPALLVSCSSLPKLTSTPPESWNETIEQRQQIDVWKMQGRLGVQTETDGGSLDLFWSQKGSSYTIRLLAPMGQGTTLIKGDAKGVWIKTAEGEEYAEKADALLEAKLGVKIPVNGLRNWLRGLPIEGKPIVNQSWDERGQLRRLVQDGWNVEISNYQKVGKHQLPHDFFLGRDDRPELGIRLLAKRWTLPE
jgi:outer membrane lipoprotein LolB